MENSEDDVAVFEELFKDRFTEKDEVYNEIKSKTLSPPAVIHPWKVKKLWKGKNWDYSAGRSQQGRDEDRSRYNDRHHSYRDRSPRRDDSRNRDRYRNDRDRSNRHHDDRNSHGNQEDRRGSSAQYRRNESRD